MKLDFLKHILPLLLVAILFSCSTKKDTFVNRNWHALTTRDNVLFNGKNAMQLGLNEVKSGYEDNFWELLPIERMQVEDEAILPGQKGKNQNFEKAETKATKAIQKHSMNIDGKEKNYQMDEAYLLLGKARYYDKRFIPALEAFNYILYKYSNSDKIYEAKIWREKTNIRLENDALAVKNLKLLVKKPDLKPQVEADANAILAQAFINLNEKDSAVNPIKKAIKTTHIKEEKARYRFILGQLYKYQGKKDSAHIVFQEIIDMKRKSPRQYVIRAHAEQAQLENYSLDTLAFSKKYEKLLKDRENRTFKDVLYHQMGVFYDQNKITKNAIKYYNLSLKTKSSDNYLHAQNYKNLAKIYFDKPDYILSSKYLDSTLNRFTKRNKEFFLVEKRRKNLDEVIKYETIVSKNDSIIKIASMNENGRKEFFLKYIEDLKIKDKAEKEAKEKKEQAQKEAKQLAGIPDINFEKGGGRKPVQQPSQAPSMAPPSFDISQDNNNFYFYNTTTLAYGKIEFGKKWGKRILKDNWRWQSSDTKVTEVIENNTEIVDNQEIPEKYKLETYLNKVQLNPKALDSIANERNMANYNLGLIYKEKFNENQLAIQKLELVNNSKPEERLKLPTWYHLFKLYQIEKSSKADDYKNLIVSNYPNTNFAQLVQGQQVEATKLATAEEAYKRVYKMLDSQEYNVALDQLNKDIAQYSGDELQPKFELLKATVVGKLYGIDEYKKAMTNISQTYPDTKEALQASEILTTNIPYMEKMLISVDTTSTNWKIIYKVGKKDDEGTLKLIENLKNYLKENFYLKNTVSFDVYTTTENFVVIHGLSSKDSAESIARGIKDDKKYKINLSYFTISSENYKVIQFKKNLDQYLALKL